MGFNMAAAYMAVQWLHDFQYYGEDAHCTRVAVLLPTAACAEGAPCKRFAASAAWPHASFAPEPRPTAAQHSLRQLQLLKEALWARSWGLPAVPARASRSAHASLSLHTASSYAFMDVSQALAMLARAWKGLVHRSC